MQQGLLLAGESTSNQNLYYTTHFLAADTFFYARADSSSMLVVPNLERGRAEKESTVADVRTFDDFGYTALLEEYRVAARAQAEIALQVLRTLGIQEVSVEPTLPILWGDVLRAGGMTLDVDPAIIVHQRRRKSAEEVRAIEDAQRATERAVHRAFSLLEATEQREGVLHLDGSPLTSERLRAEIEVSLAGESMATEVESTVAGGPRASDPHWRGSGPLLAGEAIVMDIFPRSKVTRYFADMTRTVVRGRPATALVEMHDAVMRAQEAALQRVCAGANAADVHAAVLRVFEEAGYDGRSSRPSMTHGTGHGLGLDIHEAPRIATQDITLLDGDVVTIEPGLYHPETGGVRIEDIVLVTAAGYRNLTQFPKVFQL